jgi:hypothetical protein
VIFAGEVTTLLLSGIILIFIAIYTVSRCRDSVPGLDGGNDSSNPTSTRESFLFQGTRPIDSLASNMGAAFSLTYLGATAIYSHLYGLGFLLYLAFGFIMAGLIATRIISAHGDLSGRPNVLFALLEYHYGQRNLKRISALYSVVYLGLLVEEIAVSRVVLSLIIPQSRAVVAALLATLLLVIVTYLSWGGYKAVLISDFAQLKLLLAFLLVLILTLVAANPIELRLSTGDLFSDLDQSPGILVVGLLLFVPWLASAPDFYSRLNYGPTNLAMFSRRQFVSISLMLMFAVYGVVALLGASLPAAFASEQTPTGFAAAGVTIIGTNVSRLGTIVFVASVFCMIFTTVDTLLVTYLQCASLSGFESAWLHRPASVIILVAGLAGLLLPADSISAYGLFVGALLIIPALPIAGACSGLLRRMLPVSQSYVLWSLIASGLVLVALLRRIETDYSKHYLIGLVVLGPTIVCSILAKLWESIRSLRR